MDAAILKLETDADGETSVRVDGWPSAARGAALIRGQFVKIIGESNLQDVKFEDDDDIQTPKGRKLTPSSSQSDSKPMSLDEEAAMLAKIETPIGRKKSTKPATQPNLSSKGKKAQGG